VFGKIAGESAAVWAKNETVKNVDPCPISIEQEIERIAGRIAVSNCGPPVSRLQKKLRSAMQAYAGVRRDAAGLNRLTDDATAVYAELKMVRVPHTEVFNQQLLDVLELEAMCEAAAIIAGSALLREESRGHHYRLDFPAQDSAWRHHTQVVNSGAGAVFGKRAVEVLRGAE
jgi:succinate dehydrogenase/fumarate reductase flavoprotein subunit